MPDQQGCHELGRLMAGSKARDTRAHAGFSLVELVMSLIVLSLGVVGLASTTISITRQLTIAEVTTARVTAVQSVMERIRATPYDSLDAGRDTIGAMVVSWTSTTNSPQDKAVSIVTVGPGVVSISEGRSSPMLSSVLVDTVFFRVLRP